MRFTSLIFLVFLTLAGLPLSAETGEPESATLVVGFLDEADTYNLVRHELDLIDLDSGQVLTHLKAKTHVVLELAAGALRLGLGQIRYGVRAYTPQEIEPTTWEGTLSAGQRQFVKIEVVHVLFKPSRFQLSSWSEPSRAELAKVGAQDLFQTRPVDSLVPPAATRQSGWFVGSLVSYPLTAGFLEGGVEFGYQWAVPEASFLSGANLFGRLNFSPLTGGSWLGLAAQVELPDQLRLGLGGFLTVTPPQPALGSGVKPSQMTLFPALVAEKTFNLQFSGGQLQIVSAAWLFPAWFSSGASGVEALWDALLFRPLWPSFRLETGLRGLFG